MKKPTKCVKKGTKLKKFKKFDKKMGFQKKSTSQRF